MAIALFLFASPGPSSAQGLRSLALSADNDGFVFWVPPHDRSDWYYTHGLTAEMVVDWAPSLARILGTEPAEACGPSPNPGPCVLSRFTFGQAIYTPEMLFSNSPPVDDRPYAGWLFLEAATARVTSERVTSLGIQLGVTGEPSLAGPIHRWFHKSLGKHEPQGWDHQIPFEVAFAVDFEVQRAIHLVQGASTFLRVQPNGGLTLGTLRTGAQAGMSLIAGWNVDPHVDWFGPSGGGAFIFFSLGTEGEMVLRDLFLDGSTWGQSVHAERVPLLGRIHGRLQVGLGKMALEFAASGSTAQFTDQVGSHTIGTIRIIVYP